MTRPNQEELFPMRTAVSLTGVNPVTLRAWERRYGIVKPRRTESGHRLYTRADLDVLRRVVELLADGMRIGRVAGLVARESGRGARAFAADAVPVATVEFIARMLQAVGALDEVRMNAAYNEALDLYPVEVVNEDILVPLIRELGERWSRRAGGIAEEHFLSAFLRNKLGARMNLLSPAAKGPKLLAACMADDRHELGLLMFSHAAMLRGYRVVLLGPTLPLAELAPAAAVAVPDAVVLSMTNAPAHGVLEEELPALVRCIEPPVLVGGALSEHHRAALEAAGAKVLGSELGVAFAWMDANLGAAAVAQR